MAGYFRFVLRHRVWIVLVGLALTILAGLSVSRGVMASSMGELILGDTPGYRRYVEHVETHGSDVHLIVAFEAPELAGPETRARLRAIVDRIAAQPDVQRVTSVLDVAPAGPVPAELARGLLVSDDGRHLAVVVEVVPGENTTLERTPAVVDAIVAEFEAGGYSRSELHLGGIMAVLYEVHVQTRKNAFRLTPLVSLVLLVSTWLLFRRLWPVVITAVAGALAIVWTMGFAILLDRHVNVLLAIAPSLILLISFSDVVHMCSAYLQELSDDRDKDEAILRCATEVGMACTYTSVTTFVGFLGLSLINVPAFRQLGLVLGFGVAIALLLAMTVCPIAFSLMRRPKPWRGGGTASEPAGVGPLGGLLVAVRHLSTRHAWPVIAGFAVAVSVCVWGITRIDVETDLATRMSEGTRFRRDIAYLDRHFAGTSVLELQLDVPAASFSPTPAQIASLVRYYEALGRLDGVGKVVPDPGRRRLTVFLRETGMYATYELGEAARALAVEILGPSLPVEPTGLSYLSGAWLESHVAAQRRAVLVSFAVIAAVMVMLFRSFSIGLWAMVPNLVPLVVLGGVLGWFWGDVDSDMAAAALIAIGIAVDDTIHFLTRCKVEAPRASSAEDMLARAFTFAGRAIVITSIIFAAGFLPMALSDYSTIRMLGVVLPIVMVAALAADLLLLPALVAVGAMRFTGGGGVITERPGPGRPESGA